MIYRQTFQCNVKLAKLRHLGTWIERVFLFFILNHVSSLKIHFKVWLIKNFQEGKFGGGTLKLGSMPDNLYSDEKQKTCYIPHLLQFHFCEPWVSYNKALSILEYFFILCLRLFYRFTVNINFSNTVPLLPINDNHLCLIFFSESDMNQWNWKFLILTFKHNNSKIFYLLVNKILSLTESIKRKCQILGKSSFFFYIVVIFLLWCCLKTHLLFQ